MARRRGAEDRALDSSSVPASIAGAPPTLVEIAREWGRIGITGFGGPPTHIAMLRRLCVEQRRWLAAAEFQDALAAANLLPGPASTQLAIYCGWSLRGAAGALIGGVSFILPGLVVILALAAAYLASSAPAWVRGAAAGAGAAVPAAALSAGWSLLPASLAEVRSWFARARWGLYLLVGALGAATIGPWLVLALLGCGLLELVWRERAGRAGLQLQLSPLLALAASATGGTLALAWVALKVGALAFGGGFVIVPLMQAEAVGNHHWMTSSEFLGAVALGQVTPGPVLQTVAVVGYAAGGVGGGMLASLIAFAPSFAFVLLGGRYFSKLRANTRARSFLAGAGPAAIGAILGSSVALARVLPHLWQFGLLAAATLALLVARRRIVATLLVAAAIGVIATLA